MAAFPELENPVYTASGVPFEFIFENYREQRTNRATNSTLKARVAYEDADDFCWDIEGWSTGVNGASSLNRFLPLPHPFIPNLFCTDTQLVGYPSSTKAGANVSTPSNGFFATDWFIYQLTFTRLPYFVLPDGDITSTPDAGTPPEIQRYVSPVFRPRAREFTVNSYSLVVEADPTVFLKQPAFIMDKEQDLVTVWNEVPAELFPWDGIDACLGNINNADISLPVAISPSGLIPGVPVFTYKTFPQDTLLFRGVPNELSQWQGSSGGWYYDIGYHFTYRPNGWRKLPNPGGDGSYVTVKYNNITPTKYLYERADFKQLFKPAA